MSSLQTQLDDYTMSVIDETCRKTYGKRLPDSSRYKLFLAIEEVRAARNDLEEYIATVELLCRLALARSKHT